MILLGVVEAVVLEPVGLVVNVRLTSDTALPIASSLRFGEGALVRIRAASTSREDPLRLAVLIATDAVAPAVGERVTLIDAVERAGPPDLVAMRALVARDPWHVTLVEYGEVQSLLALALHRGTFPRRSFDVVCVGVTRIDAATDGGPYTLTLEPIEGGAAWELRSHDGALRIVCAAIVPLP